MRLKIKRMNRAALYALVAMGMASSSCSCGDPGTTERAPNVEFPDGDVTPEPGTGDFVANFGVVSIGSTATRVLTVTNKGTAPLTINGEDAELPFAMDLPVSGLEIPVAGKASIAFTFSPTEATAEPVETYVVLKTNEKGSAEYRFHLVGRGAEPGFDCTPAKVDFGQVVTGTSKKARTVCTNSLDVETMVQFDGFTGRHKDQFKAQIVNDGAVPGEPFLVGARGTVEIEITFTAAAQGANQATLPLKDANPSPNELVRIEVEGFTALSAIVVEPVQCIDFGYVAVGDSSEMAYTLKNIGTEAVTVDSITVNPEAATEFSVTTELPITIAPDESTFVNVVYRPGAGGKRTANLTFHTSDAQSEGTTFTACANAFGGGPQLACTPTAIDFGMVAVDMPVTRTMRCTNAGFAPPGQVVDPLVIDDIYTDKSVFQASKATIRNSDGSTGAKDEGYAIDDFFFVDVVYNPADESFDRGLVSIETRAAIGGILETVVAGQGRNLPPCQFELMPASLEFGVVNRGDKLVQAFTFKNVLATESCLISDLRLSDDSDEAYSVTPINSMELQAGGILKVPVTFAPTRNQPNVTGTVQFQISNRDQSLQTVPLRGTAAKPCIEFDPTLVDFGKVGPGCQTRERFVQISNACQTPVTVTGIWVNDNGESDAFNISRRPNLPRVLKVNERDEFGMVFAPDELGVFEGTLRVETASGEVYLVQLTGEGEENAVQTDTFNQKDRPKVDVLWVMDNSGSFGPFQTAVAQNLPSFLTFAEEQRIDFHIGVTTSGLTTSGSCPGGAQGGEDGRLFPIDGSHPRILTPTTPDLATHWSYNMMVGECHGSEYYYEAARRALSEPLISSTVDARYNSGYQDGNAGFLRKDASLSIIVVADEHDQSGELAGNTWLPADYLNFFRNIKGQRLANMFKFHAITGGPTGQNGSCAEAGDKLLYSVNETQGTWVDICSYTNPGVWKAGLKEMSKGAFGFSARFFLRGTPGDRTDDGRVDEKDIEVRVDGKVTPPVSGSRARVWTYDPLTNAVDFAPLFIPAPGAQLTATYAVKCIPKQ